MKITIKDGDVTLEKVNAVVNPTNLYGYMSQGVSLDIKIAAGAAAEMLAVEASPIPLGAAAITKAGAMPADSIIHTTTVEQPGASTTVDNIKEATKAALECAEENNFEKVAMPCLITDEDDIEPKDAAIAMLEAVINFSDNKIKELILIDKNPDIVKAWNETYKGKA